MKLSSYVLGVPAVVIAAVVAVANRQSVVFSLDPFSQATPALALRMPLFIVIFLAVGLGVLLGGLATFLSRKPPAGPASNKEKQDLLREDNSGTNSPSR